MKQLSTSLLLGAALLAALPAFADEDAHSAVKHTVDTHKVVGPAADAHDVAEPAIDTHKSATPGANDTQSSLAKTQSRLDALIKAAAEHDLVSVKGRTPKNAAGHGTKFLTNVGDAVKGYKGCVSSDIFSFPDGTIVNDYDELVRLRNSIVTGPDEFDLGVTRKLVTAYIGLGFGEEALLFAEYLKGKERKTLMAMARVVDGLALEEDVALLKAEDKCFHGENDAIALWARFADMQENDHAPHHKLTLSELKVLKTFPKSLAAAMRERFGVTAVKHGELVAAKALLKALKKANGSDKLMGDEAVLFESLYKLAKHEAGGAAMLEQLAQKEGLVQSRALMYLDEVKKHDVKYDGYEQDLDAVIHIYEGRPEARQALAQKIGLHTENGGVAQALALLKRNMDPHDTRYQPSLSVLGEKMQAQLLGDDNAQKLAALNVLVSDLDVFSVLPEGLALKQAGVRASLKLGLADLAPHIMSKSEWVKLDKELLGALALNLPADLHVKLPAQAYATEAYSVSKIKTAFQQKRPKRAMELLRKLPGNSEALQVSAQQAWQGGYWSLARNAMVDLNKDSEGRSAELKLAESLSVSSPLLTGSKRVRGINELNALQAFLEDDLTTIKGYVNGG